MSQLRALDQIKDNIRGRWSLSIQYEKILFEAIDKCREMEVADNDSGLTPEQNKFMSSCTNASFSLNKKGLVNVNGNFSCRGMGLSDFKGIKFGIVKGSFDVSSNNFSSFEGFPTKIGANLDLRGNKFQSLKGCPECGYGKFGKNPLRDVDIVVSTDHRSFDYCSVVSELTLSFIYGFMIEKKISYSEAISCLEPYIKKGIDDKVWKNILKSYTNYCRDKWKEDDWYNLNKEDLNQELGKGSRLLYRSDD